MQERADSGVGRRTTLRVVGGIMVGVGLVLMPLPIVPGWPLVIAGAALIRKARKSQQAGSVTPMPSPTTEVESEAASA